MDLAPAAIIHQACDSLERSVNKKRLYFAWIYEGKSENINLITQVIQQTDFIIRLEAWL